MSHRSELIAADIGAYLDAHEKKGLLRFMEDSALRIEVGTRARDIVFQRHTWAANARFLVQLAGGENSAKRFAHMEPLDCDTH